jgi:hypothetical protein
MANSEIVNGEMAKWRNGPAIADGERRFHRISLFAISLSAIRHWSLHDWLAHSRWQFTILSFVRVKS